MLSALTRGRVPAGQVPTPEELPVGRLLEAVDRYRPPEREDVVGPPSRALLDRLDADDIAELRRRVEPELKHVWDTASPTTQEHLKLIFGVHYGVEAILEKTGLSQAEPPEDVHAMGRGPLAAGGDFWLADLLAGTAERCGAHLSAGTRVLDFGCSSGRHLRVLQAWRPEVGWMGCDPNEPSITWASRHLPGIEFFVSPQEPPLDLGPGSLDVVYAVSVWSHFGAVAAERWLAEMQRLIRPGGLLILTTQGIGSVAYYLHIATITPELAAAATEDLLAAGHHYRDAFGEAGDWGVKNPGWGLAYMTLEWLAERATPAWSLVLHEATRVDSNQNLVVLRREAHDAKGA